MFGWIFGKSAFVHPVFFYAIIEQARGNTKRYKKSPFVIADRKNN